LFPVRKPSVGNLKRCLNRCGRGAITQRERSIPCSNREKRTERKSLSNRNEKRLKEKSCMPSNRALFSISRWGGLKSNLRPRKKTSNKSCRYAESGRLTLRIPVRVHLGKKVDGKKEDSRLRELLILARGIPQKKVREIRAHYRG